VVPHHLASVPGLQLQVNAALQYWDQRAVVNKRQNDQELLGHFQVEFPESVLKGQRDFVKVDREMGAKMGAMVLRE
jgi:hypothetical protein